MHVGRTLQARVVARLHKYVVLVLHIHLLELPDFLQHHIVHAVLVLAEYPLCFNADNHYTLFIKHEISVVSNKNLQKSFNNNSTKLLMSDF